MRWLDLPSQPRSIVVPKFELHEEVHLDPRTDRAGHRRHANDFVRPGGSLRMPAAEATIAAINRLLQLARTYRMRVVYSRDTHRDGGPGWQIWPSAPVRAAWGWQFVEALAPADGHTVIRKLR